MSIFIISPNRDPKDWIESFKTQAPDIAVHTDLDAVNPKDIQLALVWNHQHGALQAFPNLKLISSMGAGVDHIFADDKRPQVPVARVMGEALTVSMSQYILAAVLQYQRKFKEYALDQAAQMWNQERGEHSQIKVGILGMGSLGLDAAMKLDQIGIEVIGYGRSAKSKTVVPYYHGDQLEEFLGQINVLVCLLPLTEETKDILNINLFRKCQPGTYLINVARGLHLVEDDLIKALNEGLLSGAFLDVFRKEPLEPNHPFWKHPQINITPHIASVTKPALAVRDVIINYRNLQSGEKLINLADPAAGY